jgi:hypothetical protein
MSRASRVQSVSRLLFKDGQNRHGFLDPRVCATKRGMVKREPTRITVGSAMIKGSTGDTVVTKSVKKDQAWRYPGGVIQRHSDRWIGLPAKEYWDDKDPSENRRKHESNFFITLNTNRSLAAGGAMAEVGKEACRLALVSLSKDEAICQYLKFGPKTAMYQDDRFVDVIQKIEWNAGVETGEQLERLHAHIWLTVHHYSQVQVNMPVMQHMFKQLYNNGVPGVSTGVKGGPFSQALHIRKNPYINVKLLPTSDWAEVMKQYIHKAMTTS